MDSGEVYLEVDLAVPVFDVQADEWTLHLEGWPITMGFVALDDEPATLHERQTALDAALENQHMAALRAVNRHLDNGLVTVLTDSGDELSLVLASVIGMDQAKDLLDSLDGDDDPPDPLDENDDT